MKRAIVLALMGVLLVGVLGSTVSAQPVNFRAVLSGSGEVPEVDTRARGFAMYQLNDEGTELSFILVAANIQDITQAHIHVGAVDANGPVVAFLLHPVDAPVGRFNGVLAQGTITEADLVGPLAGQPFGDLIEAMQAGNTYTNVHTAVNPGGAIRGQNF